MTNSEFRYLNENDIFDKVSFEVTPGEGYVMKEVDAWVNESIKTSTQAVNSANDIIYKIASQKDGLETELANLKKNGDNASLNRGLEDENSELKKRIQELEQSSHNSVANYDTVSASTKAERILTAAAEEATEHVNRALRKTKEIEAESYAEAEKLLQDAYENSKKIIAEANAEGEQIKVTAVADAAEATATAEKATTYTKHLFQKIVSFHEFETFRAKEIFNIVDEQQ